MTAPISIPLTGDEPCRQVDADLFYPASGDNGSAARAAELCRGCHVLLECLTYAVKHEAHGIWAGTTPKQRKQLRRMGRAS